MSTLISELKIEEKISSSELEIFIESDRQKCREIWEVVVSDKDLPDNWEFRETFNAVFKADLYFIVGKIKEQIIGFIPLEYDKINSEYIYFGAGDWNEGNKFYFLPGFKEKYLESLFEKIPTPTSLSFISHSEAGLGLLEDDQEQYFVAAKDYDYQIEKFMQNIGGKTGNTVRRQIRQILEQQPTIDHTDQYNFMVEANKKRFGDDSIFVDQEYIDSYRQLLDNSSFKDCFHFINIYLAGKLVASYLTALYNNKYYCLVSGYDVEVPNISKYQHYLLFADGFAKKADRVILFVDDCGWKEHWKLSKEMLFKYNKI